MACLLRDLAQCLPSGNRNVSTAPRPIGRKLTKKKFQVLLASLHCLKLKRSFVVTGQRSSPLQGELIRCAFLQS